MVTATTQSYEGIELRRTVTDNAGRAHQTRHDTLGRVVRSIENVTGDGTTRGDVTGTSEPDENRTTVQQYDQAGRLATQIALSLVLKQANTLPSHRPDMLSAKGAVDRSPAIAG